ncbi:MAG TPA: hypothetical protein DET40_19170 [Lentisphaeria bacterium]|nr:MAG: hypothetical protein A2X45_18000 [Lentisphaerae bacterium GWF2_50_93]HCE45669.1 hypothetical protein [Lentisphaeria bacterium]
MKIIFLTLLTGVFLVNSISAEQQFAEKDEDLKVLAEKNPDMDELTVSGEEITDKGMPCLAKLGKLRSLAIIGTGVTDEGLESIKALANIERLVLNTSNITDKGLLHLRKLDSLTSLELETEDVTDEGLKSLHHLKRLTDLGLCCPNVAGEGIGGMTQLVKLRLAGDSISDKALLELGKLIELRELQLSGKEITGPGLGSLKDLKKLESLSLSGMRIAEAELVHIQELPKLTRLELDGMKLTNKGLDNLMPMKGLSHLTLKNTQVTQSGEAAIKKAIPGLVLSNTEIRAVDVFTKDGRIIELNSYFGLYMSDTPYIEREECKDIAMIENLRTKLKIPVQILINGMSKYIYPGGGMFAPLNEQFHDGTIREGDNVVTLKDLPPSSLYFGVVEFEPGGEKFRHFIINTTIIPESGKTDREFVFTIPYKPSPKKDSPSK